MDTEEKNNQLISLITFFDQLESFNFDDPSKIMVVDAKNMQGGYQSHMLDYAQYKNWFAFTCNTNLFPLLETFYTCKKCKKSYGGENFINDYGTIGQGYYGCYIKCFCNFDEPSLYYAGDEEHNDKKDLDFKIHKRFNSIIITKHNLSKTNSSGVLDFRTKSGINGMEALKFYYIKFDSVKDIFGSSKINEYVKELTKLINN